MKPPCPRCGWRHVPSLTVGRITWATPLFRAPHDGSPLRDSRIEAERDQCDHNIRTGDPA